MAKHLNVNLEFDANVSKAKAQIQSLVTELNKLSAGTNISKDLPITQEILEAQNAAKQLGMALENAVNVNTGKLDLTAFNQQLKQSGMSLQQYSSQLTMLGQVGDRAFLQVAQSIVNTQAPLRRSNAMLQEFATTLQNTARWQISSMILHGFLSSIQTAYGYAQDLNESLNNIRIVTGANADEMARFAKEANKAAQALSTTTTAYTNASLIYYQQGLSEEEVKKRADITVKMANVSRQSAEVVSDQLTSVWNNFYDGTKSLEYYADVMTALGAATASSADEIAGGLEKFAAIGETIGLSYEYAASALATITSNTRQSEEVVGTALKTIFARIQGLNLGETLDDGTTLNKYSEALNTVGISIYNQAGELKKMDDILDEMGSKWDTLNKAQQTALAQTVAGVRQYTQLISLMENWNSGDSDSFQANLSTARSSSGALQDQADIYAESWEASSARVKASLESIFDSLVSDDFFINLNDSLSVVLNGLQKFIDSIGGVKGVLFLLGSVLTKVLGTQMTNGINNAIQNFRIFSGITQQETAAIKKAARDMALSVTADMDSFETAAMRQSLETTYSAQERLASLSKTMSAEQLANAESAIKLAQSYNEQAISAAKAADAALKLREEQRNAASNTYGSGAVTKIDNLNATATGQSGTELLNTSKALIDTANKVGVSTKKAQQALNAYAEALRTGADSKKLTSTSNALLHALNQVSGNAPKAAKNFQKFQNIVGDSAKTVVTAASRFQTLKDSMDAGTVKNSDLANEIKSIAQQAEAANLPIKGLQDAIKKYDIDMAAATGPQQQEEALKQLVATFNTTTISAEQMNQAIIQTGHSTEITSAQYLQEADSARQAEIATQSANIAIETAGEKSAEAAIKISNSTLAYQSFGSALTGTLQGLSSFAMGLTSLKSAFDTLKDPDMGTFEKFSSILMSLGMGLPMMISSFSALGNAIKFVTSATAEGLTGQLAHLLNIGQEITKTQFLVMSKENEVLARYDSAKAAQAEAATKTGATVVTQIDTKATWANIAAKLIQHWYIGLIVIALGALAAALYAAVKAYNADAEAAKKAAENAKALAESHEETKQRLEDLRSAFNTYDEAVKALEECTRGTDEWNAALQKVNDTVLEILTNNPELLKNAELFTRNSEGMLELNEAERDKILKAAEQQVSVSQAAALFAAGHASEAANKRDATYLSRDVGSAGVGHKYYTDNGVYYDQILDVGRILTDNALELVDLTETEYREKVATLLRNASTDQAKSAHDFNAQIDALVEECVDYQSRVDTLAKNTQAAADQLLNTAMLIADQHLGDDYDGAEKTMAGAEFKKLEAKYLSDYKLLLAGNAGKQKKAGLDKSLGYTGAYGINKGSNDSNEIYQFMAQEMKRYGLGYSAATGNTVQGNDNNRRFVLMNDATGERETKEVDWVAAQLASARALEQLQGSADSARASLEAMDANIAKYSSSGRSEQSTALRNFIAMQTFENENISDFDTFFKEVSRGKKGNSIDNNVTKEDVGWYIDQMFGDGQDGTISDETAKKYGYDTAEAMINSFYDRLTEMKKSWDTIELPEDLLGTEKVSFEAAQKISNAFKQINLGPAGQAAGETFTRGINKMLKNLSKSDQQAALEQLATIDWSNWDALEQADLLMKQFGVDIDTSTQEWKDFATEMRIATGAIPDYSQIREDLAVLNSIIDNLDFGSLISDEDYSRLVDYNDEWERFFILQADGSRMFIGNSTTMRQALQETQKAMIEDMAIKQGFLDVNWGYKDAQGEWQTTDWSTVTGDHIGAARNLMNAGGATEKYLKSQGYDDKIIEKFIRDYEGEDPSKQTAAKEALQKMFDTIAKMQDSNITQELEDMRSMYASTAVSYQELNTMLRKGDLGTNTKSKNDIYKKQLEAIARTSFNDAATITELDEAWASAKNAGAVNGTLTSITDTDYSEQLIRLGESSNIAATALERYQEVLESGTGGSAELAAQDALKYALLLDETAQKYGINAEELQNLTIQLTDTTDLTAQKALDVATGYLTLANELGISASELISHLEALSMLQIDPSNVQGVLEDLGKTAQETGFSIGELVDMCTDLSKEFNLTGESADDAIVITKTFAKSISEQGTSIEELTIQTEELQQAYNISAKDAAKLTVANQRMNKGVASLHENWKDLRTELDKTNKTTTDYAKAAAEAEAAIRDLLNLSDDFELSDTFFDSKTNLDLIGQAAEGDEKAIRDLGMIIATDFVSSLDLLEEVKKNIVDDENNILEAWGLTPEKFDEFQGIVQQGITQLQEQLNSLTIGADVTEQLGDQWITALNEMAMATNMSVEQMNSMLSSMGVSANIVTKYVDQEVTVPEYTTEEKITTHTDDEGNITGYTKVSSTSQTGVAKMMGQIPVASISTDDDPKTPEVTYIGRGSVSPSSTSGDKGGKAASPKTSKYKAKRHVEKDEQIDDIDEEIKDLERRLDAASGEEKVQLLKDIQSAKDRKAALIGDKVNANTDRGGYLEQDEVALATATGDLAKYGVSALQLDDNFNITNYETIWEQIRAKEQELLTAWNNDTSESNEQALDQFYTYVSAFEDAYERFVDTREETEDFANEMEDLKSQLHEAPDLEEVEDLKLDQYEHAFADVTTEIEAMERATERANKEADNLYGAKRAQALGQVNNSIRQEIGLLQRKIAIAQQVAKFQQQELKMSLLKAQAALGLQLQFEFAADGSITNLSAVMQTLIEKYNELVETYKQSIADFQSTGGGIEDWEKEKLEQMEASIKQQSDFINTVSEQASRYNETLATISESMDAIADKQDEIKSNNYEILTTKLNYALDMTSAELQEVDYQLNKISDDFYKMAEAAGLMISKVGISSDVLSTYKGHLSELDAAYQSGYIHQADYVAGMQEARDAMYSELEALNELDKSMLSYYSDTLDAAGEELAKYTDRMDSLTSVLDHYQSLMGIIGQETDYDAMNIVLEGMASTAKDSLEVSKATAEFYANQAAEKKRLMDNAIEGSEAFELYKKEWEAAEAASREAKDQMLAKTEEWANREKAIIQNALQNFKRDLEKSLTGGTSFDELSTKMDRAVSLQEEYLTTTNQVYETTKLINTAQKALDATSNTAAKQKLKSFINETDLLKNKNKLSKYELELQQAQYQILQAEIALEEAQNAKSTVRLQRDSEGRFGYIYTADRQKVADAEQKLADAQNAMYNKSLEGANNYVTKYKETLQSMWDELARIQEAYLSGEISTQEEYNRLMQEAQDYYYQQLEQYSELYQIAVTADSRTVRDAWSTDFADMTTQTENWKIKVDAYVGDCEGAFARWAGVVAEIKKTTGADLDTIAAKVGAVTTASADLAAEITNSADGVITALEKEMEAVSQVTSTYAQQRAEIKLLISEIEGYISTLNRKIAAEGAAASAALTDPSSASVDTGSSFGSSTTPSTKPTEKPSTPKEETPPPTEPDVESYQTGVLTWKGTWPDRVWTDSSGNTYNDESAIGQRIQAAFNDAYRAAGGEYKGDWFLGWNRLNADILHKKYGLMTGGYTGDWTGSMGKLAFLHQKEIVLNKEDTANLLATVEAVRSILQTIDAHSLSAQLGGILTMPGFYSNDNNTLEQNVKIEASFPNVQDHNEIEEAFNNLINKAAQYANRK